MRKTFPSLILSGFVVITFGQACSDFAGAPDGLSGDLQSSGAFSISPERAVVAAGQQIKFRLASGVEPYTCSIIYGEGVIDASAVYRAPAVVTGVEMPVSISCADGVGEQVYASLSVQANSLRAVFTPERPVPGNAVAISVLGGQAPYRFQILSGLGTLNGSTYSSVLQRPETASIQIFDATGLATTVNIPIGQ